jgi:hypothetical protein
MEVDLSEIGNEGDSCHLALDKFHWRPLMENLIKLQVP